MEEGLTAEVPGISVSAASDEENEEEFSLIDNLQDLKDRPRKTSESSSSSSSSSESEDESRKLPDDAKQQSTENDAAESLATNTEDLSLNDETQKPYEIVGDRILIERDGKFELVDVSEVKADYFQMMGLHDTSLESSSLEEKPANEGTENEIEEHIKVKNEGSVSPGDFPSRPKTSPVRKSPKHTMNNDRVASAFVRTRKNDEYAHIKSRYAMTEHQLEMKRRREEVIARRKKEEDERERQEMERKSQDSERAFQAWLKAKNDEAITNRKHNDDGTEQERQEKNKAAVNVNAYKLWLAEKAKQKKQDKIIEQLRQEEEASSYIIRQRYTCEEAFNRWLKTKQAEAREKQAARRPRRRRRNRRPKDSSAPINSSSIRFTDYYGYRNTVAL